MSEAGALWAPIRADWGDEALEIIAALREREAELATETVLAIRAEIPRYAEQASPQFWAAIESHVASHFATFMNATSEGELVTRESLAFIRGPATARARAGISVGDFMHAFRVGQRVLWQAMMNEAALRGSPSGAIDLATPWMEYVDLVSTLASESYFEAQEHLLSSADRLRRDLLDEIVSGRELGPRTAATAAEHGLGVETSALAVVGIGFARVEDAGLSTAAQALGRAVGPGRRPLALVRGDEVVVIGPVAEGDARTAALRVVATQERLAAEGIVLAVGVSTLARERAGLTAAYHEARSAAGRAQSGGTVALPVLSVFDYLVAAADDTASRLIDPRVRELLAADRAQHGTLVATMHAFLDADLNVRRAAERLHIHENTMHYRLARIAERTGLEMRRVPELIELILAAELLREREAPTPGHRG